MNEKNIKLIVDSSIDLPREIIEQANADVVHFTVNMADKEYTDGVDITTKELFELTDKYGQLPKTSAVGPAVFDEVFKKYQDYKDVIFIGLGSGFTSSYTSAMLAASEYENVHVIDSKNLSSGTGLLVLKIIKFINEGMSANDIVTKINEMVPNVRTQFAVDTLKYLHMGGRCKSTTKYIATALHIKPIIAVRDGKMEITKKPIGYKKALDCMLEQVFALKDQLDLDHIMVTHPMADSDAVYLKEKLATVFDKDIIMETHAGGTIATHCGPRTIGILYILK